MQVFAPHFRSSPTKAPAWLHRSQENTLQPSLLPSPGSHVIHNHSLFQLKNSFSHMSSQGVLLLPGFLSHTVLHLGCVERFTGQIKNSHDPPQYFMESSFYQVSPLHAPYSTGKVPILSMHQPPPTLERRSQWEPAPSEEAG